MLLAYIPDLMDRSRLGGLDVRFVSSPDELQSAQSGDTVLVDLGRAGAVEAASAAAAAGTRVVGFASHVDDTLLRHAAAAGIEALPRSRFFKEVAALAGG